MSWTEIWMCWCIRRILCSKSEIWHKSKKYYKIDKYCRTCSTAISFAHCTLTVPSDEALMMWSPSSVKDASFTNDEWPFNSFSVLPDLSSWILKMKSLKIWKVVKKKIIKLKEQPWLINKSTFINIKRRFLLTADEACYWEACQDCCWRDNTEEGPKCRWLRWMWCSSGI